MPNVSSIVEEIISTVRTGGDAALCAYAKRFDQLTLKPKDLIVSDRELKAAKTKVSPAFLRAMKQCAQQIEQFARLEKKHAMTSWMESSRGLRLGQLVRPVDSAGLYIPGGRFPYPSTVLMTTIPARIAGVSRIVLASPPKNLTPEVLAAAEYAGVKTVYRMGGAGAIAAFAYGTKRVQKVDFIVGPGNQFVTEAKRQVYGQTGIDSLAGPSEVAIVADRKTPAAYVLADLSAQAEHDPDSRSILLSTDRRLIKDVSSRLSGVLKKRVSFRYFSTIDQAIDAANAIGAEHLELLFNDAPRYVNQIRHAGAIFVGPATTAVLGDYVAGPSHVLPTRNSARFSSGLSVTTFMKRSSVMRFSAKRGERALWEAALTMAQTEGMVHHEQSLRVRLQSS